MTDTLQLQLHIAQHQANELTDCLLAYQSQDQPGLVFSTSLMRDYQLSQGEMTAREQVQGYQHAQLYFIQVPANQLEDLLAYLRQNLPRLVIQYQVVPVLQNGRV